MRTAFFLITVFTNYFSFSQSKNSILDSKNLFDNMKKELVEVSINSDIGNINLPFSNIKILDKRYDTSAIGYFRYDNPSKHFYKLVTKQNLSSDLEAVLSLLYKGKFSEDSSSLIIAIRKFWFYRNYNFNSIGFITNHHFSYFLTLGIDFYYFLNGTYKPLIRKDTLIEIPQKFKEPAKGILIGENLKNVFDSFLILKDFIKNSKRKLSYQELENYYTKNFQESILLDHLLKKGVYMNFEEFKNNNPSITNFDIRKTSLADDIYTSDGKDLIPNRKAWGYCDGDKIYIKLGMNLFELFKQGNSYSLLGNEELTHKTGSYNPSYNDMQSPGVNMGANAIGNLIFAKDKFKVELIPLQLDMQTGKPYQ